jgi:four helix bundle protein
MDLVEVVYRATSGFPRDEIFGLVNQLRRAVVSIPSNIAEGQGRGEGADFVRYLRMSRGSLQEVETQILIARRLGYLDEASALPLLSYADEVSRLISGLMRSV